MVPNHTIITQKHLSSIPLNAFFFGKIDNKEIPVQNSLIQNLAIRLTKAIYLQKGLRTKLIYSIQAMKHRLIPTKNYLIKNYQICR